jgi:hypothetical protein
VTWYEAGLPNTERNSIINIIIVVLPIQLVVFKRYIGGWDTFDFMVPLDEGRTVFRRHNGSSHPCR